MGTKPFIYQDPYPLGEDATRYRKVGGSEQYVSVASFDGNEILKVDPEALTILAYEALRDISFLLRAEHNDSVGRILRDPEASPNDKGVAVTFLRNAAISARFELPVCQDTGTAAIIAKKGQRVWTGGRDEEALSRGVYKTYTEENLRYSQTVALDTAPEMAPYVATYLGADRLRLSSAALETLAVVAYRQPVTRAEVESIRGVNCDQTIYTLMSRRLIEELGRREAPGSPFEYGTTWEFLECFGLTSLDALPTVLSPEGLRADGVVVGDQ